MKRSQFGTLDTRLANSYGWLHDQLELERQERDHEIAVAKELAGRAIAPLEPLKEETSTEQDQPCS